MSEAIQAVLWLVGMSVFIYLVTVIYESTLPSKEDRMKEILDQYPECVDEIEFVTETETVYIKGMGYDSPTYFLVCESKQIKLQYYPKQLTAYDEDDLGPEDFRIH